MTHLRPPSLSTTLRILLATTLLKPCLPVPATAAEPSASTALSHLYDTSAKRASELKLAESRPWLKLLHYERGF
ncbi:MAG: hypothetical protein H7222_02120, partial [Methylotenera sp.]|nr:hypothetical protein [Oligoflexia bacterium]